jgi:hypothetical protein
MSKTHEAHTATHAHATHEEHGTATERSSGSVLGAAAAAIAVSMLMMWGGLAERTTQLEAQAERNEAAWALAATGDEHAVEALGGPLGYVTFKRPRRAQAWRLNPGEPDGPSTTESFHGYGIISGPVAVDEERLRALTAILESPNATQVSNKRCGFSPGVAVRWKDGPHSLDLLVCFSCNDLQYYFDEKVVDSPYDFMRVRPALVAEVKKLFPRDEKIQALPDKK